MRILSKGNVRLGFLLVLLGATVHYARNQDDAKKEKSRRMLEAGSKTVPAVQRSLLKSIGRSGALLNVRAVLKPVCWTGDLDIIETELRSQPHTDLLLTAEPLERNSQAVPVLREVTLGELLESEPINLVFPGLDVPTSYGLFLCRSSRGTKKCSDKPVASISELSQKYKASTMLKSRVPAEEVSDKIYFFSYLVLDGTNIYYASNKMAEADLKKMRALLVASGKDAHDMERVFAEVRMFDTAIDSLPPRFAGQDFTFFLPRYDAASCSVPRDGALQNGWVLTPENDNK